MKKILIVEDDFSLSAGLCRALKTEEIQTFAADTLYTACGTNILRY